MRDNFGLENLIRRKFGSGPQPGLEKCSIRTKFLAECWFSRPLKLYFLLSPDQIIKILKQK